MKRAVFLDRDGVINKIHYNEDIGLCTPHTSDEFVLMPRTPASVKKLKGMGFSVILVGNQPDISKGRLTMNVHEKINQKMISQLAKTGARLDGIYYCFHRHEDNCECRKPKAGMLLKAGRDKNIDIKKSYIIGDTLADVEAGKKAGCKTILVANVGLDLLKFISERKCYPDYVVQDLHEAASLIGKLEGK